MPTQLLSKRTRIRASTAAAYRWHAEPGALDRLAPPGQPLRTVSRPAGIEDGSRVSFRIGPLRLLWVAEHPDNIPGRQSRDVQIRGPFRRWEHTHRFLAGDCFLLDEITYELPFGCLGRLVAGRFVRRKLERLFAWRHQVTREALKPASSVLDESPPPRRSASLLKPRHSGACPRRGTPAGRLPGHVAIRHPHLAHPTLLSHPASK